MPFQFDQAVLCPTCPHGFCFEDRRANPVRGRSTQFRLNQGVAMHCTFEEFLPGGSNDPDPSRSFDDYLGQFRENAKGAGGIRAGSDFSLSTSALAKVEGDVFELMEAGILWEAAAAWNRFMDSGLWDSDVFQCPAGAVAAASRKIAIVKLPRGYDTTRLFKADVRSSILAFEQALKLQGMELGLSSPDIVGVRLPHPLPPELQVFLQPMGNLSGSTQILLAEAHRKLEGLIAGSGFLMAIAVKRTTRSDRLYQPLFEANVLKYLIQSVLEGAAFRFYAHLGSFEGADVQGHYSAASLISLLRGGQPSKAVDVLYLAKKPRETGQSLLNEFPLFPI